MSLENVPLVSVIMPVYNEAFFIEKSLGAVLEQTYPHNRMEVLIADGMSTDRTREIIRQTITAAPDISVIVLDNPGRIAATGFNTALTCAAGEIIVRVDGHTVITPDYVAECVHALAFTGADNVGGRMRPVSSSKMGQVIALATSTAFGVGDARFHYSEREQWVDTVYLGAWKREVFDRIGRFGEDVGCNEDDEFNYRLLSLGGKIYLSSRITSHYYNRETLRALWRQYFQYGYWKVRVMQKHPRQMRPRQFVPPLFVFTLVISLLLLPFASIFRYLWAAEIILYLLTNLTISVWITRKRGCTGVSLLPIIFSVLHVAYGVGFLIGLVHFLQEVYGKRKPGITGTIGETRARSVPSRAGNPDHS